MTRKGTINVKAGSRFTVDYETYVLREHVVLDFECRNSSEAGVYLSRNPLSPEQTIRFNLNGKENGSIKEAAGQLVLSLARRYHKLAGQDPAKRKSDEDKEIGKLRNIFRFLD